MTAIRDQGSNMVQAGQILQTQSKPIKGQVGDLKARLFKS